MSRQYLRLFVSRLVTSQHDLNRFATATEIPLARLQQYLRGEQRMEPHEASKIAIEARERLSRVGLVLPEAVGRMIDSCTHVR